MRPSENLIAMLLLYLVRRRNEEVGRDTSRIRVTRESLKRICGRDSLQDRFVDKVIDLLPGYGWIGFRTPDDDLALIELARVRAWVALSTKRLLRLPDDEKSPDFKISCTLRKARRSADPDERRELFEELERLLRKAGIILAPDVDDDDAEAVA